MCWHRFGKICLCGSPTLVEFGAARENLLATASYLTRLLIRRGARRCESHFKVCIRTQALLPTGSTELDQEGGGEGCPSTHILPRFP